MASSKDEIYIPPEGAWLPAKKRDRYKAYLRVLLKVSPGPSLSLLGVCVMAEEHPRTPGLDCLWATIAEAEAESQERAIDLLSRSIVPAVADLMRGARRA